MTKKLNTQAICTMIDKLIIKSIHRVPSPWFPSVVSCESTLRGNEIHHQFSVTYKTRVIPLTHLYEFQGKSESYNLEDLQNNIKDMIDCLPKDIVSLSHKINDINIEDYARDTLRHHLNIDENSFIN